MILAPMRRNTHSSAGLASKGRAVVIGLIVCVAFATLLGPATALAITRDAVLARAQSWVNNPVPYSQAKYHETYRTDCSGYASMVWQTGFSWSTSTMHDISYPIPASELKPGDVMLKAGSHVRMFYGWVDDAHTAYVAYEQTTPNTKSSIKSLASDVADGYKPYRYSKITDSPPSWNVLRNPSFDVWASSAPAWWTFNSTGVGTSWQVRRDQAGSPVFSLGLTNADSVSSSRVDAGCISAVEPGKTYALTVLAGTTTSPSAVRARVVALGAANEVLADVSTTGDKWGLAADTLQPMSLSLVMPAGATAAVTYLSLAGSVNGVGTAGGSAVFDDAALYVTSPLPVYRFYNPSIGTHFYTASGPERDSVVRNLGSTYVYEGPAYGVVASPANSDPLYRFYNHKNGSHFYTASSEERDRVKSTLSATYTYDGPAYNVSVAPVAGALPVYRFYNRKNGSHFYTTSDAERDSVVSRFSASYTLEGPAFYLAQ